MIILACFIVSEHAGKAGAGGAAGPQLCALSPTRGQCLGPGCCCFAVGRRAGQGDMGLGDMRDPHIPGISSLQGPQQLCLNSTVKPVKELQLIKHYF